MQILQGDRSPPFGMELLDGVEAIMPPAAASSASWVGWCGIAILGTAV